MRFGTSNVVRGLTAAILVSTVAWAQPKQTKQDEKKSADRIPAPIRKAMNCVAAVDSGRKIAVLIRKDAGAGYFIMFSAVFSGQQQTRINVKIADKDGDRKSLVAQCFPSKSNVHGMQVESKELPIPVKVRFGKITAGDAWAVQFTGNGARAVAIPISLRKSTSDKSAPALLEVNCKDEDDTLYPPAAVFSANGELLGFVESSSNPMIAASDLIEQHPGTVESASAEIKHGPSGELSVAIRMKMKDPLRNIKSISVLNELATSKGQGEAPDRDLTGVGAVEMDIALLTATANIAIPQQLTDKPPLLQFQFSVTRNFGKSAKSQICELPLAAQTIASPVAPRPDGPPLPAVEPLAKSDSSTPMPGRIAQALPAERGRLLVIRMADSPRLVVFDIGRCEISREIRLSSDDFALAAGGQLAVVLLRPGNRLESWNLRSGERVAERDLPEKTRVADLIMGRDTDERLAVAFIGRGSYSVDPWTLDLPKRVAIGQAAQTHVGNETTFVSCNRDASRVTNNHGYTLELQPDGAFKANKKAPTLSCFDDLDRVYAANGNAFDAQAQLLGSLPLTWIPALGGNLVLGLNSAGQMQVFAPGEFEPLGTWSAFPEWNENAGQAIRDARPLPLMSRVIWVPELSRAAIVPLASNSILVRLMDVDKAIADRAKTRLIVTSSPPLTFDSDRMWTYKPVVAGSANVKLELESAPDGMNIGDDGVVSWIADPSAAEESAVNIRITSEQGLSANHSFRLRPRPRPAAETVNLEGENKFAFPLTFRERG
jgi:hypothetical protein